jgi:hypothetical protein
MRETSTSINSRPSRLAILLPFFRPRLPTSPGWDGVWSDALSAARPLHAPIKLRRTCYLHIWRTRPTFGGTSSDKGRCDVPPHVPPDDHAD